MKSVIITHEQLENYPCLNFTGHNNSGDLYKVGSKIYKLFKNTAFIDERKRNIEWLLNSPSIEHTTYPQEKVIMDSLFAGYTMIYIENSLSFRTVSNIDLSIKLEIIKHIFIALKEFHKRGVILGDIHLDNFIHNGKEGWIADLDDLRFPGDEFKFRKCYCLKPSQDSFKINKETRATDNIKATINALSFLLNYDFEFFIKSHTVEDLNQLLLSLELDLHTVLTCKDSIYFDEVIDQLDFAEAKQKVKTIQ